ncbi:MAG: hypothetical protein LBG17_06465 [Bacteroidales bacterium]|jgi:hypothetical protein|nr:hypothetical protein [Bacteroidales bacterium]
MASIIGRKEESQILKDAFEMLVLMHEKQIKQALKNMMKICKAKNILL